MSRVVYDDTIQCDTNIIGVDQFTQQFSCDNGHDSCAIIRHIYNDYETSDCSGEPTNIRDLYLSDAPFNNGLCATFYTYNFDFNSGLIINKYQQHRCNTSCDGDVITMIHKTGCQRLSEPTLFMINLTKLK